MARPVFDPDLNKRKPAKKMDPCMLYITPLRLTLFFLVALGVTVVLNGH